MTDQDAKLFWMDVARWIPCLLCRGVGNYKVMVRKYTKGTLMEMILPDVWQELGKTCPHCKGTGRRPVAREWKDD